MTLYLVPSIVTVEGMFTTGDVPLYPLTNALSPIVVYERPSSVDTESAPSAVITTTDASAATVAMRTKNLVLSIIGDRDDFSKINPTPIYSKNVR